MKRATTSTAVLYALAAIFTFGRAFTSIEDEYRERCEKAAAKNCDPYSAAVIAGFASALVWPLYWSVQAARKSKGGA